MKYDVLMNGYVVQKAIPRQSGANKPKADRVRGRSRGLSTKQWWALVHSPGDLPVIFATRRQATGNYADDGEYLVRVSISEVRRAK